MVDLFFNNVGIVGMKVLDKVLCVNILGFKWFMDSLLLMMKCGGVIINMVFIVGNCWVE